MPEYTMSLNEPGRNMQERCFVGYEVKDEIGILEQNLIIDLHFLYFRVLSVFHESIR
jgi:hypothetical protein